MTFPRPSLHTGTLRPSVVDSWHKVMAEPASEAAFTGSQPSSPALFSHPKQLPVFKWNLNDENTLGFLALKQRRFESIQDCGAFKKLFFLICRWDSVEAWLVDFFTVARQGHKPRFQTPTWARAFSCVVEAGVPPPEGVFKRMRTKDILVSSKVWTWSLHLYWKIYHLRNTHWFHHMGGGCSDCFLQWRGSGFV